MTAPASGDDLRSVLARMMDLLDDLLWVARDRASEEPVCTPEAQRLDIDRHGAELRARIRLAMAKVHGR